MNCAACHTAEVTYQSKRLRIEGGPTMADFQGFMLALNRALEATRNDPDKWSRFASRVLAGADTAGNRALLEGEFTKLAAWQSRVEQANHTPLDYGYARLDAFGHIFNKILLRTAAAGQPTNPSDAPVSYPFLWNVPQHDKVQWNGIASNFKVGGALDLGALARNVGEVTGVFADLQLLKFGPAVAGYPTSADVDNLVKLENQLASLKPPAWPAIFPPIDAAKWEAGKALFERPNSCSSCHATLARDDLSTPIKAVMTPLSGPEAIGTDPWMACNAYTYRANTGALEYTPQKFFVFSSPQYGENALVADMLGTAVIGSLWFRRADLVDDLKKSIKTSKPFDVKPVQPSALASFAALFKSSPEEVALTERARRLQKCMSDKSETLAYKGRPLVGIWATAPYLHNGSVPSLYDLLLPPADRPQAFGLGTREFDPEKVGYANEHSKAAYFTDRAKVENTFVFRVKDASQRPIQGNSNLGHDYANASLSDADRWALVEYMKAPGGRRVGGKIEP